ncbi:MAG: precorrin-3B C(17)-methyltransferase, partial [Oscillochloris sp.]|nr:precorrin-3B C(17)-methyltransferase [Oscillochloris sp.]
RRWIEHRPLVLIMSTGIAVRACAPLLGHKASDPAVVCLDEAGRSVIPLLGGHRGGANELAHKIAALTGGHAAVTTASDTQGLPALDLLGRAEGWKIAPDSALTHAMGCLVNGESLGCYVDPALAAQRDQLAEWLSDCPNLTFVEQPEQLLEPAYSAALLVSHRTLAAIWPMLQAKAVCYVPPVLVAGLGCRRGVPADELGAALETVLGDAGFNPASIAALATVEQKADEPGMIALAQSLGVPLQIVTAAQLANLDPARFSPSAATAHLDLPGVAERAAVLVSGGSLLLPKRAFTRCTVAVAANPQPLSLPGSAEAASCENLPPSPIPGEGGQGDEVQHNPGHLTLVSLGPGDPQQMTLAAHAALRDAEVVVGYQGYIDSISDLLTPQQQIIASGMKTEMDRALQAIEQAEAGRRVALVSSGDIGIYAMAGPVFEGLRGRGWDGQRPRVTVLPGISAFQAAAAQLGAAISHDFSVISLSDLLTPWELIERRVAAAAAADMVVAFYNPRSRDRHWQLGVALDILRAHRPPTTPVTFATNVARPDQRMVITTLAEADPALADMFTVVLIGNSRSYVAGGHVVTPRGYEARARGEHAGSTFVSAAAPAGDYPVVLTGMVGAPVVVVGGGAVGERKVRGLLATGAVVRLISPEASAQLQAWAAEGQLAWEQRPYVSGDLVGVRLAFAASNQRDVNAQVAQDAAKHGVLCNVADAPAEGSFHVPALHRTPGLTIAVSTSGAEPARAATIRDAIARWLVAGAPEK